MLKYRKILKFLLIRFKYIFHKSSAYYNIFIEILIDILKFKEKKMKGNNAQEIPLTSNDLETISNRNIADYGYKHCNESKDESGNEETYRTHLRRQRDKILYTGGFRRLQDKTQVIPATISGDHRTRLTHTLEVEQIAVSIANSLKLNPDLVSAIALGHDVGHTPFGHAAERELSTLLKNNGEFHHPIQSIRYLWEKYGKNIDGKIYEGILLHDSDMFKIKISLAEDQLKYIKNNDNNEFEEHVKLKEWINSFPSTLEAQVVIWADKIAYITHDLEDFLRSPVYTDLKNTNDKIEDELCEILSNLINKKIERVSDFNSRDLIRNIIFSLITNSKNNINNIEDLTTNNVREKTRKRYEENLSSDNSRNKTNKRDKDTKSNKDYLNALIINCEDAYRENYYKLREFLNSHYIFSTKIQRCDKKAEIIVKNIFKLLRGNYKLLPLDIRNEIDNVILKEIYKQNCDNSNDIKIRCLSLKDRDDKIEQYKESNEEAYYAIIDRKVASYIATMTDSYAESMYKDLLGTRVDFIL